MPLVICLALLFSNQDVLIVISCSLLAALFPTTSMCMPHIASGRGGVCFALLVEEWHVAQSPSGWFQEKCKHPCCDCRLLERTPPKQCCM